MSAPAQVRPFARHVHPLELADLARDGQQHCGTRRCREPIAVYGWYYRRCRGQVLGYERYLCTGHGEAFAARHHLAVEDAPPAAVLNLPRPAPRLGARLEGMSAQMTADHEAFGWHCDRQRCRQEARYLSSHAYRTPAGRFVRDSRFLCVPHARRFAARHGLDFAAVLPPEESQ